MIYHNSYICDLFCVVNLFVVFSCLFHFYFRSRNVPRTSIRPCFMHVFEGFDSDRKIIMRAPTQQELEKADLEKNKVMGISIKIYSNQEKKFVNFTLQLLIQQGDENSLLKRGVYFNLVSDKLLEKYSPAFVIQSDHLVSNTNKVSYDIDYTYFILHEFMFMNVTNALLMVKNFFSLGHISQEKLSNDFEKTIALENFLVQLDDDENELKNVEDSALRV
uniref:Uncharacterized protein n=1 Tax=Phalansterium sp. PJK-2012 TaxID=1267188 RepID=T1QE25_9EUKA|nr:hypothetical protein [Phalansterium sp. PJK-2012]